MKIKRSATDGSQPRDFVFKVLRRHGVRIEDKGGGYFRLLDHYDHGLVLALDMMIPSEQIAMIYRRYGGYHKFEITDLVHPDHKD